MHIVTGAESAAQNIEKCIQRCGLAVDDIVLEQLASSYATLTEDEKDLGVCLVDIGGGTTDIAVFTHGAIRHTAVIPVAGDQVTNDIAMALRTPTQYAEEIKIKYACALAQLAGADQEQILARPFVQPAIDIEHRRPCIGARRLDIEFGQRRIDVVGHLGG